MRCRYVFEVQSLLKLGPTFPIDEAGMRFGFHVNEQHLLNQLSVEISVPDDNDWPSSSPTNLGPIKANLRFTYPRYDEVRDRVRFLESAMGIYGLERVNIEEPELQWTSESPEERARLSVHSYVRRRLPPSLAGMPEVRLGMVAQSLYAYKDVIHLEPGLNFVRRALLAVREDRFIEAIYNAYFYLETSIGNGKTKNVAIAAEFRKSGCLRREIESAVAAFEVSHHPHRRILEERFRTTYEGKSTDETIQTIVETRGFLHHHNQKRPGMWHPSEKWEYATDALLLTSIVHRLAIYEVGQHVFSRENQTRFERVVRERKNSGAV